MLLEDTQDDFEIRKIRKQGGLMIVGVPQGSNFKPGEYIKISKLKENKIDPSIVLAVLQTLKKGEPSWEAIENLKITEQEYKLAYERLEKTGGIPS